jgi:hypothetical protein
VTATGPRLWAGLNAPDQRPGTGATERYFSYWLAAAIYVKIAEELEAPVDMRARTSTTTANPPGRQPARKRLTQHRPIQLLRRRSQNARSGRIHREAQLDFETHGAVAFARRRREPRSVDLDLASTMRSDRSAGAQIAHQERYRRSSHTEYLRQRLLSEREDVVVDAVAKMKQPACHAGFDRMQGIAGHAELKLHQHRPGVNLDRVPDRGAPVESGVKSRCRDPRGGARRTNDGGNGRR